MKKIILILIFLLLFMMTGGIAAGGISEKEDIYAEQLHISGADRLYDSLPDRVRSELSEMGIIGAEASSIADLDIWSVFGELFSSVREAFPAPCSALGMCMGIMLICSLADGTLEGASRTAGSLTGGLCICTVLTVPLCSLLSRSAELIKSSAGFMELYIPVMSVLEAASGKELCASSYYSVLMAGCAVIGKIAESGFLPFMNILIALSVSSSMAQGLKLSSLFNSLFRIMKWMLVMLMSIFVTLLSAKTFVSSSLDRVSKRALRIGVSSIVPVVGGVVSETIAAFSGSIALLKNGVGVFAVIAVGVLFLPVLVECLLWRGALAVLSSAAEILNTGGQAVIFKSLNSVCAMLMALLICILILFVISTVIILLVGT